MQIEALKAPGSKFASEHHGGKAGRLWGHKIVIREQEISFQPKVCNRCQEAIVFTEQEEPYCPVCGVIKGNKGNASQARMSSKRSKQERTKRMQGYKRFRMYGLGQLPAEI